MGLSGLGWQYNPLVLELNRDKGFLLRGQVSLSIYKGRRCINLIKQELEGKAFSLARPWARPLAGRHNTAT